LRSISQTPIKLKAEGIGEAEGELIRFLSPRTVDALVRSLPVEGRAALMSGGIYFSIPLSLGAEKARRRAEKGTIAYWPMGRAICIFYEDAEPYSPISKIGRVKAGLEIFRRVKTGTKITIEKT